jgi:hypothetical protein
VITSSPTWLTVYKFGFLGSRRVRSPAGKRFHPRRMLCSTVVTGHIEWVSSQGEVFSEGSSNIEGIVLADLRIL